MTKVEDVIPINGNVLCRNRRRDELVSKRGLIDLPQTAEDRQLHAQWIVVDTASGVDPDIQVGQHVLLANQRGVPVDLEWKPYIIVHGSNIQAIFQEKAP